ncbi:MAG: aldehyde:ferredoxin oxidoreductase, partial [Phycisphaerae bacterium]|nr:aldehyde:ferredoxin oxidoreductase [Phycisphaerae bacterium]NIX27449.1 aldehyde:ferredoxin oxidoreductase [Phycisphaerae bacterium]
HAVPENNFRPTGEEHVEKLFRENVTKDFVVKPEGCFRCGIRCHNNIHKKNADGSQGEFLAKFDFEPLNLLGSNLGINDAYKSAKLIHLCDNLGMDAISLGTTISYLLDYNERNPEKQQLNGATFGDYEKIYEI